MAKVSDSNLLAPELFGKINAELGDSLVPLESKDNVIGREDEIKQMRVVLNKKERPVVCLVGGQGTGKSAIAGSYKNRLESQGKHVEMFQLRIGEMADDPDKLKARMNTLLEKMKEYKDEALKIKPDAKIFLFIDEVHMVVSIFGEQSKIGGDLLKESLARAEEFIGVITATTFDEYQSYLIHDKALSRRLNRISINETSPSLTLKILKNWLAKESKPDGRDYTKMIDTHLLKRIIQANRAYQENEYEPAKSIDVLSSVISDSEIYDEPITEKTLGRVFKAQYNIEIGFNIDPDKVMRIFRSRIKGQPLATAEYERMIREIAFQLYPDYNKPRGTLLSVGTTGTGKTEACKVLALALFGDKDDFIKISMTDYGDEDGDRRIRQKIGEEVSRKPFNILLLDEVEKASNRVINVLLPILDEGSVVYQTRGRDGTMVEHKVSLKNTIIVATSNAGVKVLQKIQEADDIKFTGEELTEEMEIQANNVISDIRQSLEAEKTMKPEFLARFGGIVPFRTLEVESLLEIARNQLDELIQRIYDVKGLWVTLPPDKDWSDYGTKMVIDAISMYIVRERMDDETNAGQKGAREIENVIRKDILSKIIYASDKHPYCDEFKLLTNGKSSFEDKHTAEKHGLIRVEPVIG